MAQRYLFFLRSHNDTDNIAPAIWFLLHEEPRAQAEIIYYHLDYPYRRHPYISHLTEAFGARLRVRWIGEFLGLDYDRLFSEEPIDGAALERIAQLLKLGAKAQARLMAPIAEGDRSALFALAGRIAGATTLISDGGRDAVAAWALDAGGANLVIFDHQRGYSLVGHFGALRRAGVKRIARLPVSPMMNINVLRQPRYVTPDRETMLRELDFSGFDAVAYTDPHYPNAISRFYSEMGWGDPLAGKIEVLGSIRYCAEWLAARPPPPPFAPPTAPGDNRIKLVFFLSRPETNTFWQEVQRTISVLDAFPRFRVIVQPHPRDADALDLSGSRAELCLDAPAASLIAWADAVMLWGSSVGLEALIADKTLLCLDYVNANRNIYALMEAGWVLHCRDDLVLALARLSREPSYRPYAQANVDRLIREMVGGGGGVPTPQRYVAFLKANASE